MPADHVERGMILSNHKESLRVLCDHLPFGTRRGIKGGNRDLKVTGISTAGRTDHAQLGELKVIRAKNLKNVTSQLIIAIQSVLNAETNTSGDNDDLGWIHDQLAKLRLNAECPTLRDNEHIAIGRVEALSFRHRLRRCIDIDG